MKEVVTKQWDVLSAETRVLLNVVQVYVDAKARLTEVLGQDVLALRDRNYDINGIIDRVREEERNLWNAVAEYRRVGGNGQ